MVDPRRSYAAKRSQAVGATFENQIEWIAGLYRRDGLADLRNVHTGQATGGGYRKKVAGDYQGAVASWHGRCVLIECKARPTMFHGRKSYDLRKLPKPHQRDALDCNERCFGRSFLVIQYNAVGHVAAIPWETIRGQPETRWTFADLSAHCVRYYKGAPDILRLYDQVNPNCHT